MLKFEAVNVRAFPPVLIDDAPRPERLKLPDVAVKFNAPVVCVSPFEAVRVVLKVLAPVNVWVPSRNANVPLVPMSGRVYEIDAAGLTAVRVISFPSSTVVEPSNTKLFPLLADESVPVNAVPDRTFPTEVIVPAPTPDADCQDRLPDPSVERT